LSPSFSSLRSGVIMDFIIAILLSERIRFKYGPLQGFGLPNLPPCCTRPKPQNKYAAIIENSTYNKKLRK
jgi:hypothetical protein